MRLLQHAGTRKSQPAWAYLSECEPYLNDLELHPLVRLRTLEAVADGLHQPVDQPLARGSAVRSVAGDVAVRYQLLQSSTGTAVTGHCVD